MNRKWWHFASELVRLQGVSTFVPPSNRIVEIECNRRLYFLRYLLLVLIVHLPVHFSPAVVEVGVNSLKRVRRSKASKRLANQNTVAHAGDPTNHMLMSRCADRKISRLSQSVPK